MKTVAGSTDADYYYLQAPPAVPAELRSWGYELMEPEAYFSSSAAEGMVYTFSALAKEWMAEQAAKPDPLGLAQLRHMLVELPDVVRKTTYADGRGISAETVNELNELLRRAERALAQSIKLGQDAKLIGSKDFPSAYNPRHRDGPRIIDPEKRGYRELFVIEDFYPWTYGRSGGNVGSDGRRMAELNDEQFERALEIARGQSGLLTRAKLMRSVNELIERPDVEDLPTSVSQMAARGATSRQMAADLGRTEDWVRRYAADHHIDVPGDRVTRRTSRIDYVRIIRETAVELEGTVSALDLLDLPALTPSDELREWADSITASLREIGKVNRKLKEYLNGH